MATQNSCDYSPTQYDVQIGGANGTLSSVANGSNGQVLIGSTSAAPAFATLTSSAGSLTYTTGANTLNIDIANYSAGSFTPGITFGGGNTGITYTSQIGDYTRIGNVVNFMLFVNLSNKGSSTGNVAITGLPYTINASYLGIFAVLPVNITFVAPIMGVANATQITLQYAVSNSGSLNITNTGFANNSQLYISGSYLI